MTRPQEACEFVSKLWDFGFAVVLIGGLPLAVAFADVFLLGFIFGSLAHEHLAWEAVGEWGAFLVLPLVTFCLACWWRRKRRVLPISLFPLELIAGLLFGALFFVVLAGALYGAYADN